MRNWHTIAIVLLVCTAPSMAADEFVRLSQDGGQVNVTVGDAPFATLHLEEKWDKPFIQPIYSPEGIRVTRGYPLEKIESESTDHIWHRGLWFAHGDINGVDFWREKAGEGKFPLPLGRIIFDGITGLRLCVGAPETPGSIYFSCGLQKNDKQSMGTLHQYCEFQRLYGNNVIDIRIRLVADKGQDLVIGDTEEGTLGLRLRDEFRQDRGAVLLNSNERKGTENIWGKRARWVDYSTVIDGKTVGVAILDHPNNLRHPTYWHARGYALFCANPFGIRDFTQDKSQNGQLTIDAGHSMEFHYRIIIHSGSAQDAGVENLFRSFIGVSKPLDVKDIWLGSDQS